MVCVYCALWGEANSSFNIVYEVFTSDPFVYVLKGDDTYEIVDLTDDTLSEYIIPDMVNGKKVTSIADSIFYPARSTMTNVVFGNNIKKIGAYSFYHCKSLTELNFNEGLEEIGKHAFQECDILSSITIPTTFKTFGKNAFTDCFELATITYKAINANDMDDECRPFSNSSSQRQDMEVIFTEDVIHIPACLFRSSSSKGSHAYLTKVTIGENVQTIGDHAFYNSFSLATLNFNATRAEDFNSSADIFYAAGVLADELVVNMGNNVENIPANIFHGSSSTTNYINIKSLTIPEGVKDIGASAFKYTFGLEHLYFNAIDCANMEDEDDIFYQTATLAPNGCEVVVGDQVTRIPAHLLHGSSDKEKFNHFTKLTIGLSVKEFGLYAFRNCYGLKEVLYRAENCNDLSSSLRVFDRCGENTDGLIFTVDDTVQRIPAYLCETTTSTAAHTIELTIGQNVTSIGSRAFGHFEYLSKIFYNATAMPDFDLSTFVEDSPNIFYDAGQLNENGIELVIGENVTSIPSYLFHCHTNGFPNIKTMNIPEKVEFIGEYAFPFLYNLETLNYNAIKFSHQHTENMHIFNSAGRDVQAGLTINFGESVWEIPDYLFYPSGQETLMMNIKSLTIPDNVQRIGSNAFNYNYNLLELTIGTGVKELGDYAFGRCNNLATINYKIPKLDHELTSDSNVFYRAGQDHVGIVYVIFSDDVIDIPAYLFCNSETSATTIDHVYIGANVQTIGNKAFEYCLELATVIIGSETIYSQLQDIQSAGLLIEYAKQIAVKDSIIESLGTNDFLENNYTKSAGEGDYVGFTVYSLAA